MNFSPRTTCATSRARRAASAFVGIDAGRGVHHLRHRSPPWSSPVGLLRFTIEQLETAKLDLVVQIWRERGVAGGAVYAGCCVGLCWPGAGGRVGAVGAGLGLLPLIAYLTSGSRRRASSRRSGSASCAPSRAATCGPEGPIIHIGACIGKQLLRLLYTRVPHPLFRAFRFLRNDLTSATSSPSVPAPASPPPSWRRSGTLVVEEAATHFSVPLLWRAFSAAYVSMYTTHLIDRLRSGEFNGRGEFQVTFEHRRGLRLLRS